MRIGSVVVLVWLIIGVVAAAQRDNNTTSGDASCAEVGDTVLTVIAGPLNYMGVNPKVDCKTPEPSK
jgi:hypothetical protein